jgi:hypothetical protein
MGLQTLPFGIGKDQLSSSFSCSGAYVIILPIPIYQTVSGRGILRSSLGAAPFCENSHVTHMKVPL